MDVCSEKVGVEEVEGEEGNVQVEEAGEEEEGVAR